MTQCVQETAKGRCGRTATHGHAKCGGHRWADYNAKAVAIEAGGDR